MAAVYSIRFLRRRGVALLLLFHSSSFECVIMNGMFLCVHKHFIGNFQTDPAVSVF